MIEFLNQILGTYTPMISRTGEIAPGMAGVDWPYLIRAIAFLLAFWCVMRILGGIICK